MLWASMRVAPAARAAVPQPLAQRRQQSPAPAGALDDLLEPPLHQRLVAVGIECLQPLELGAFGLGIDAQDVLHLDRLLDELIYAHHDVLAGAVALVVAERRLLDLALDELNRIDRSSEVVDLGDEL